MSGSVVSTMEYENLEQKYFEVKTKLKRSLQNNEKHSTQIQKLNKRIKQLEKENSQLENKIQNFQMQESESDISSSDGSHHKNNEVANLVHSKNLQISDLLRDIEEVEQENQILREKLAETKDALSTVTTEISSTADLLKTRDAAMQELIDLNKKMTSNMETLQEDLETCKKEKCEIEKNLELFSAQVNKKVDEWKEILDKKNLEIAHLKNEQTSKTSLFSIDQPEQINDTYLNVLKKALNEAEAQLGDLKSEMEKCTQDLKDSAEIINKLSSESKILDEKNKELTENERELKNQLNKSHERSQNLQKEVEFANKLNKVFETDMLKIKEDLKNEGQIDQAKILENNTSLKVQNLFYEKQIAGLIKDINRLQDLCNGLETENAFIRQQLGIDSNEDISINEEFLTEGKKQLQQIKKLKGIIQNEKEEKIKLKMEIKDLNKKIGNLTNEILELKHNPQTEPTQDFKCPAELKALSEENEALRKGLHEILNSVQEKSDTSPKEIKSSVLENLLKALDVKHISGWYHPAMRLQAELHTLEGVNKELREQLHQARTELEEIKVNLKDPRPIKTINKDLESKNSIENEKGFEEKSCVTKKLLDSNTDNLQEIKINLLKIIAYFIESKTNVTKTLEEEFEYLQNHIQLLHENCRAEESLLLEKLNSTNPELEDQPEVNSSVYESLDATQLRNEVVKEKNKVKIVIKQLHEQKRNNFDLKGTISNLEREHSLQVETLLIKIVFLQSNLRVKDKNGVGCVNIEQFKNIQGSLNENIVKYRKLLADVEVQKELGSLEIETLRQVNEDIIKENTELKTKLKEALYNSHVDSYKSDPESSNLSKKLSDAEVAAHSEKQRADHTNNLYELVKEQLRKSEERFSEFSKYAENLLQKNVSLQERVAELEDKVCHYIDQDLYKELQIQLQSLIEEKEKLMTENLSLKNQYQDAQKLSGHQQSNWNHEKEHELLELRHQIVDLTATSEEKLLIGQLQSDLARCRSEKLDQEQKVSHFKNELDLLSRRFKENSLKNDEDRSHFKKTIDYANKKIFILQDLSLKQRIQYHGYVPLISQEIFAEKISSLNKEKHEIFVTMQKVKNLENQLQLSEKFKKSIETNNVPVEEQENISNIFQFEREYKFKNQQNEYLVQRLEAQEKQLVKLEQELLFAYRTVDPKTPQLRDQKKRRKWPRLVKQVVSQDFFDPKTNETQQKILRNVESQTEEMEDNQRDNELVSLNIRVKNLENQISDKARYVTEMNSKLIQKEMEIDQIKSQLDEKTNRITCLEKNLAEFSASRSKSPDRRDSGGAGDGVNFRSSFLDEEIMFLKDNLKSVQEKLAQKDEEIMKYQTLLKEDRDKHSLAAANLHREMTILQKALIFEQQKKTSLDETVEASRQKAVIVEKYITQVRALETHLADLHTQQAKLESQLMAAQQEASRWRQMAQERLVAMQELGKSLNEQHNREITNYKTDYEKLKELSEIDLLKPKGVTVNENTSKFAGYIDPDILKLFREKDEQISELNNKLKQAEAEKHEVHTLINDNEGIMCKEIGTLRKRYESLLMKEMNAREEIRDLKEQLSKRTQLSARSNQSDKSLKKHLQLKVESLEKEIEHLNDKLAQQMLINEKHKLSANEDFGKWKKQKYWQENCEKYKNKLQEREEELQKLQQACSGYRLLIERLEREKINLENRIKTLKSNPQITVADQEIEFLKAENEKLSGELSTLQAKMELRQQGAGTLGAAIMQEKLEAQERKIAILELSAKGTVEVRNELERLQQNLSNTQKRNLCLEAENLELRMDLEKCSKETPHLQEQIQHLESYIELLKNENQNAEHLMENVEDKKLAQLERTVFILKRVVEKLQVENKRLISGKRPLSERSSSAEKLKRDYLRLKEQNTANLQRIKELETKLSASNKKFQNLEKYHSETNNLEELESQLEEFKSRLVHKTTLLDKAKELLHGAAAREKQLLREITDLRNQSGAESLVDMRCYIEIPSPIEEVPEEENIDY